MASIADHTEDVDPNSTSQMEEDNNTLPHSSPLLPPDNGTGEEQFYDTEADEEHLELSNVQLSGTKEAQEESPEDEDKSKRFKTATAPNTVTN